MTTDYLLCNSHGFCSHDAVMFDAAVRESCSSSLRRVTTGCLLILPLFSLIFCTSLVFPACAQAATWPLSVSSPSVELGFQESYTAGAKSYVHSGIDASASAGLQIVSPLAGTVRFTGTVPSGDSRLGQAGQSGKTMRAVSIQIADGRTVTLMPFDTISVKKGQQVAEGEALGTLAASGDASSAGAHLHMGLKKDGVYYDPLSLFGGMSASVATKEAASRWQGDGAQPATRASVSDGVAEQAGANSDATSVPDAFVEGVAASETGVSYGAQPARRAESFGTISSGGACLSPQVAPGPLDRVCDAISEALQPCLLQAWELWDALKGFVAVAGAPPGLLAGVFAGVLLAVSVLAGRCLHPHLVNLRNGRKFPLVVRKRG